MRRRTAAGTVDFCSSAAGRMLAAAAALRDARGGAQPPEASRMAGFAMAQQVQIRDSQAEVKLRSPWAVALLPLITFGIYHLVWWYRINREMRDFGRASGYDLGQNPTNSLLALFPGALIVVPPFVSYWRGTERVQGAARVAQREPVNGWIALILFLLLGIAYPAYLQASLNQVWLAEAEGLPGAAPVMQPSQMPARLPASAPAPAAGMATAEAREQSAQEPPRGAEPALQELHPPDGPAQQDVAAAGAPASEPAQDAAPVEEPRASPPTDDGEPGAVPIAQAPDSAK